MARPAFRNPMDPVSIRVRIVRAGSVYNLVVAAAGHQGISVDKLADRLRRRLPSLLAEMATEIEQETP
jgi:hypothetical protein